MLPRLPDSELVRDSNPLVEAVYNYKLISVEAYVVHVDLVSQNEVAFKLTPETIESLVEFHKEVHSVDTSAATWSWSEKSVQLRKLQEDFVQAANKYVYRTNAMALEGLEEDGAGELLCGRSEEVKSAIMGLFLPLLPPPPRPADAVRSTPVLPSSTGAENWWQPTLRSSFSDTTDTWKFTKPSTDQTSADSSSGVWGSMEANMGFDDLPTMQSPTSSYSDHYTVGSPSPPQYYSLPVTSAPIPQLPLPSTFMQQPCGTSVGFEGAGFGGFGWDSFQNTMPIPYAI